VPPVRLKSIGDIPKPSSSLTELLLNNILWHHDSLLVMNKPSGMAVHGGSGVNLGLVEALRQISKFSGFLELVIMLAQKRSVLKRIQGQFREREGIKKHYLALVQGQWPKTVRRVDVPLLRRVLPGNERVVKVDKEGKAWAI